ncbi:ATP-dependent zinc metalloprotease YME1, variant 2 [Parelaphostrongylus tenuis]|uniref:ATP-dependent zinc metalloprotease YME1, variant 2 n=1 Tax=Parelaphostrongylus tenuis TaxID=148309 RepID=A0AAD5M1L3_PARTN|nr:ATP-dependent zinc metalloprotease YME1, variant 2 [Parelaphostrongylus tenuis]
MLGFLKLGMQIVNGLGTWSSFGYTLQLGPSHRRSLIRKPVNHSSRANSYVAVGREIGVENLRSVLKKDRSLSFITRRAIRRDRFQISLNGQVSVCIVPSTGSLLIQERGFRTKRAGNLGINSANSKTTGEKKGWSIFASILGVGKKGEETEVNSWNQYDSELKKLPESQQKTFTEGFIKGLLTSKSAGSPTSKKSNTLTRFYIFLAACIFIGYLTGTIRVRIGDRQFGSLFFSNTQEVKPEDVHVTFDDVRGMDEAKMEVQEIVAYLRDPEKYSRLGGRLPKGVLLVGPPGTGKTLLARAIAGEAQVPFFHTSGSEFDEVLVGQGARRVRDLFDKAKARAPCIIFIDEIDSVGSKRVSNSIHPYANQTINQLLSEMDGFNRNEGVIVIAATNRVDDLDKALLRPGRFDVRVTVPKPDLAGRTDIFNFYLQRIVHSPNVDPRTLAKGSTGFTGADIENMVNQAALKAAKESAIEVTMAHLDEAKDRVLMGPARTGGRIPDEEANRNTAYHEAGHTLVSLYTKHATPLHKVTIIPRGQSLGHTATLPEKDEYQLTKGQLLAALDVMMGGRVAEEIIFGDDMITTGAADDLKKASQLAVQMVKVFGMSDKVGLRDFTADDSSSTTSLVKVSDLSPQTAEAIDKEINQVLQDSYQRAKDILLKHRKEHQLLAEALLEYETLSAEEVKRVISGKKIKENDI